MGQPIVPEHHSQMPPFSHLARPIVALKYLWIYTYKIKKIEIVEAETGNKLKPRNMKYLEIYPIESKYWILFSDGYSGEGLPLPVQDIQEINKKLSSTANIITRKKDEFIEISFVGNKTLGHAGIPLIAAIKLEDEYVSKVYELLRLLKQLQYDSSYWLHHSLYSSTGDSKQTVDIYPNAPYLADGEEMCWQSLVYESVNNEEKISQIDAVTNYRIFQYNYHKHHGSGFCYP